MDDQTQQLDLPQVPVSGKTTSVAAYNAIVASGLVTKLQRFVVEALFMYGPQTANEITERTGAKQRDCVRPRLTELKNLDVVEALSKRKCTISGKVCLVWDLSGRMPRRGALVMERCPTCNGKGKIVKAIETVTVP